MKNVHPDLTREESSTDDAPTRERVAGTILELGPSTAAVLAERLGLTPAAVRRHLDQLEADGVVESRSPRTTASRGRGRPAKLFAITDAGRDRFDHAYDALAADALRFVAETAGEEAVMAFARRRLDGLRDRYAERLDHVASDDRPEVLARALSDDNFAASITAGPNGHQLCQHHCPVAHVAHEFPQLCEAEAELFAELLGTHVQRLATIAHGDGVCTTHLPAGTSTSAMTTPGTTTPTGKATS